MFQYDLIVIFVINQNLLKTYTKFQEIGKKKLFNTLT